MAMDNFDAASLRFCWERLAEMHLSTSPTLPAMVRPHQQEPCEPCASPSSSSSSDPLTVEETDLERRCLGTLTDALRAVICYAHSSYKIPISFKVKRFDRAHGQVWVKVSPEEVPEGFDLKYLLQHIKFYENIPRYAELLGMDDYKLRGICQYFLDLQSKAVSPKSEDPMGEIGRVRETISRASKWVHDMMSVGITDRDVVQQLREAQARLRDCSAAVDKFITFQQNQSEVARLSGGWFPEKQQWAARSIHQQMQHLLDDPDVVKYMLQVVGPRLGLVPFQLAGGAAGGVGMGAGGGPPAPGHLLAHN